MTTAKLDLEDDLVALLNQLNQPLELAMRELMVMELYRRGSISSGKAAQLLGMSRWQFVHNASHVGIAFYDMTSDEWAAERDRSETL